MKTEKNNKDLSIKSISSKQGRAMSLTRELVDIKLSMEKLKERDEEIRNRLNSIMDLGDAFELDHEKRKWIIEKYEAEKTVLLPVEKIFKMTTPAEFIRIVSVTIGRLKEEFGKQYTKFVDGYDYEPTVRLREKKEK